MGFSQQMRRLELDTFGVHLHDYHLEIKGSLLLSPARFKSVARIDPKTGTTFSFSDIVRRELTHEFLEIGKENTVRKKQNLPLREPGQLRYVAYAQGCLHMASNTMRLLREHEAKLFAVAIPRGAKKHSAGYSPDYLRKDLVYLFERYNYFLEEQGESGLLVMDQIEKTTDRKFGQRIARYFATSALGHERSARVVPVPLFVTSELNYAIQAADLCIYAINCGFRLPMRGMDAPKRAEIADQFGLVLSQLQWQGYGRHGGDVFPSYGIVYVADPFGKQIG